MNAVIQLKNLYKTYGTRKMALSGLNLSVEAGRFVGFFGPNGAGKTTTIKILLNLLPPTSGSAEVLQQPSHRLGPKELQRIGYVSENQELPLWMTLEQWLNYCRPLYPAWDETICQQLQNRFQLPMKKTLKSFSRGMRMKAALLSSLSYLPELVILDEPFSGLDPLARDQFVEGLMELASQKSFTMFLSTHDVSEVERLCDTVVFLHSGKISLVETTEDLLHRYRRIEARANEERPPTRIPDGMFSFCQEGRRIQYIQTRFKNDEAELCELQNVCPGSQLSSVSRMSLREIIVSLSGPKGARA